MADFKTLLLIDVQRDDDIIKALVTIGNHKKVMEISEPNVMQPLELQGWMIKRTLVALELLEDEWRIYQDNGREISETGLSGKGSIHSDPECL